jgi:4'-phosphopantetheinyl transferase
MPLGEGDDVGVWLEWIDATAEAADDEILDHDERARARAFRFARDRRRFVARRTFLRRILAGYVGVAPAEVRYRTSAAGKPRLAERENVAFSTSHADGLAIVAIARTGEVGVDIERVRPMPDALELAERFFSVREHEHLVSIPASTRSEAFLRLWTRKEAYVKLAGVGLGMPLEAFDVLNDGDGDVLVPGTEALRAPARLRALNLPAGTVGSVAFTSERVALEPPATIGLAS